MVVIGITGEPASGKTFVANIFKMYRCAVFDADKIVHKIYKNNYKVIQELASMGGVVNNGVVDRRLLFDHLVANRNSLERLENLIHPIVKIELINFIRYNYLIKTNCVVLDIPLIFKINADRFCDFILCIDAKMAIRKNRILRRGHKSFFSLFPLKNNSEIKKRADIVIVTGIEKIHLIQKTIKIIKGLKLASLGRILI